jgi:hypothetical protein
LENRQLLLATEDLIYSFTLPPIAGRPCEISVIRILLLDSTLKPLTQRCKAPTLLRLYFHFYRSAYIHGVEATHVMVGVSRSESHVYTVENACGCGSNEPQHKPTHDFCALLIPEKSLTFPIDWLYCSFLVTCIPYSCQHTLFRVYSDREDLRRLGEELLV